MRLVCATSSAKDAMDVLARERYPNVLTSFAYANTLALGHAPEYVMLDSGAFTAWSLGRDVSLAAFAAWAAKVRQQRPDAVVVNLDVIPGAPGLPPTRAEREAAMKASEQNADALRAAGLPAIEVYHQHEPRAYLRHLLRRMPEHGILGISPDNSASTPARRRFLEATRDALLAETGRAAFPRCHGFGATARALLFAFPFYSADSSSWIVQRYGRAVGSTGKTYAMAARYATSRTKPARRLAQADTLRNLRAVEAEATRYWADRGLAFTDPPGVGPPERDAPPALAA